MADRNNRNQNTRRVSVQRGNIIKVPRRRLSGHLRLELFAAIIFLGIFIYLVVSVIFYAKKEKVSIYEVQGDNISVESRFEGIALRSEMLIESAYPGYINYYVQNGKRSSKNGVIFSVDEGSKLYSEIVDKTGIDNLQDNDIKQIKNVIYGYLDEYNGFKFENVSEFKQEISDTIYELINDSSIESMKTIVSNGASTSAFHIKQADIAGVISYKTDDLCGYSFEKLTDEMFSDGYDFGTRSLRSKGLVSSGEPVCRIVTDENWQIAIKLPEDAYRNLLDRDKASVYINDYYQPIECGLKTVQRDSSYYAILSLDKYMPMYIDCRAVSVEFVSEIEGGLKIPLSSIAKKEFYAVPLTLFVDDPQYTGQVLKKEGYSEETGAPIYIPVFPSKYYSDEYNAYIDMTLLNDGDWLDNPETGERFRVGIKNYIEGVYIVNKGYYQFVQIERIRQNAEYAIVKKKSKEGLNLYDHIALDASIAKDEQIIY